MSDTTIAALLGETLTEITGMEKGSASVEFTTVSGRRFKMEHYQDCCESVQVEDVTGEVSDLIGSPILKAEESSNSDEPAPGEYAESWTWTFYHFATVKGYVTLRWLGESNGYYSEGVDFAEVDRV